MVKVLAFPAFKNKSSNPYNYLLYSGIEEEGVDVQEFSFKRCLTLNYDLIHIHWPELYLNSNYVFKAFIYSMMFVFCLFFSKLFGKKVVWTIHNLKPHNIKYKFLNKLFWPCYLPLVDGVISLSKANEELFFDKFTFKQKVKSIVIHHGLYDNHYENNVTQGEARKYFSIDESKKVALFIGQVKTYKNVETLVKIFNKKSLNDAVLIIAGKFETKDYFIELSSAAKNNPNIIIHNKFIPDSYLQYYFNAADLCILPFKDIFNSGSALLAASFNTPVIVPQSNNFVEYSSIIKNNLIRTYNGELDVSFIVKSLENLIISPNYVNNNQEKEASYDNSPLKWKSLQVSLSNYYISVLKGCNS
jgi:glycosyltransferase involved in cell wall biosynthesis